MKLVIEIEVRQDWDGHRKVWIAEATGLENSVSPAYGEAVAGVLQKLAVSHGGSENLQGQLEQVRHELGIERERTADLAKRLERTDDQRSLYLSRLQELERRLVRCDLPLPAARTVAE